MQKARDLMRNEPTSPPSVPGLPLLGQALSIRHDPLAYFVELYHRYGPIFNIRLLNRKITVIAGLEANQFLADAGDEVFSSEDLFGGFAHELGTDIFLVAMDGPLHKHLRKIMHHGYSRSALVPHLPKMMQIIRDFSAGWKPGEAFAVFPSFQRLVTEQLGWIMAHRLPGEDFESIRLFFRTMLYVRVLKVYPGVMMWTPSFLRAKARVFRLADEVLEYHRQNPPEKSGRPANLIDDTLAACDENGQPYPQDMLRGAAIGPFFAGMDTVASQMSFLLYNILARPDVYARVQEEVDAAFADGDPDAKAFRVLTTLNGAIQETLRLHPVAPFTPRTASQSFDFAGHHVAAGTEVFVANGVTHYLPELYPDPHRFDVDRFSENGKGERGAFAPYTLGSHLCLGAGMAEAEMMITIATLMRHNELELANPDAPLRIESTPLPNPGNRFKVRVKARRSAN